MANALQRRILILAVRAGELMMKHGAEIHRVEDTINRICKACNILHVEVFATTTGVFVSVGSGGPEGEVHTYIKTLRGRDTDLGKISQINQFSRMFTTTSMTVEEGIKELQRIDDEPKYPLFVRLISAGGIAGVFCVMFGGEIVESLLAFCLGMGVYGIDHCLSKFDINFFLQGFTCCAAATAATLFLVSTGIANNYDTIIIGVLMIFVPGVAMTNAIRDMLTGDMMSGVTRLTEAVVIAVSLAAGVGIIMKLWSLSGSFGSTAVVESQPSLVLTLFLGFAPSLAYSAIYHVPVRCMLACGALGCAAWFAYQLTVSSYGSSVTACFLAACIVGIGSDILARILKEPTTIFIIPGIMPFVPGSKVYYTMVDLIGRDLEASASVGTQAIFMAGAIALGLLVSGSVIRILVTIKRKVYAN